jgi:hypothetical protein
VEGNDQPVIRAIVSDGQIIDHGPSVTSRECRAEAVAGIAICRYFGEREKEVETAMTIWKLEGKEAICEIFTARGSKGGKRNPKLRYFLQLITRQGGQRIQIRISKEDAEHCMALRTKEEQVDWLAEKVAHAPDSDREKKAPASSR